MHRLLYGLVIVACAAPAAEAARPNFGADCTLLAVQRENPGLACRVSAQPPQAMAHRRVVDPASVLKQGLIW